MTPSVDLAIYVHWPFCAAKCPYCDFNSHVASAIDHDRWRNAYLSEIDRWAALAPGHRVSSLFFGGGTPSLMAPETVAAVIERVALRWPLGADAEITLEANPGSVEAARFAGFRSAGVNRISIGIQSLRDEDLRRLGRLHTADEARSALRLARQNFARVSFDLIYARQHQGLQDWRRELAEALDLTGDHLSLYQLTIEAGTAFGWRHARGTLDGLPEDDLAADMYALTGEMCESAGLPAYEISNHARPGCESRHNLTYWRGGDYLGIGPGAHGRVRLDGRRCASETHAAPAAWLDAVAREGSGDLPHQILAPADEAVEYLMMSLRLGEGSDLARLATLGWRPDEGIVADLAAAGLLCRRAGRLVVTPSGRLVLNSVLRRLLAS